MEEDCNFNMITMSTDNRQCNPMYSEASEEARADALAAVCNIKAGLFVVCLNSKDCRLKGGGGAP